MIKIVVAGAENNAVSEFPETKKIDCLEKQTLGQKAVNKGFAGRRGETKQSQKSSGQRSSGHSAQALSLTTYADCRYF